MLPDTIRLRRQPGYQRLPLVDDHQSDELNDDERRHPAVDDTQVNARGRNTAQIEQRAANRRRQKAGLQANREQYGKPHRVEDEAGHDRRDQGQKDQSQLQPVEKETQQEGRDEYADDDAVGTERQPEQRPAAFTFNFEIYPATWYFE